MKKIVFFGCPLDADERHESKMTRLEITGDELFIGASVPVNRVATMPEVAHHTQVVFRPIMGSSSIQGQSA